MGGGASTSAPPTPSLRFASYNVLAQSLLEGNAQNYGTCAADALRAELRLPRVLAAAVALDADVVGDMVLHAIQNDEFYIFTHPEIAEITNARYQDMQAAFARWTEYRKTQGV